MNIRSLKQANSLPVRLQSLIAESNCMRALMQRALKVSPSHGAVLITGESGTGKELFAKLVHDNSYRTGEFVNVNCAALPANLIESELFGHEKGAFTDALQQRIGRFEFAEKGTLLLDEVTEMPTSTQVKLLRALEVNEIQRIGSNESIGIDVRIVSTSNRDIAEHIDSGDFRHDLFHRLNVFEIRIPALRDRTVDIPILAEHFLQRFRFENSHFEVRGISQTAKELLMDYHWPGNVRELRNVIHRGCVLTPKPIIEDDCLELPSHSCVDRRPAHELPTHFLENPLAETERLIITAALRKYGSRKNVAAKLGVTTRTLANKLKIYSSSETALSSPSRAA